MQNTNRPGQKVESAIRRAAYLVLALLCAAPFFLTNPFYVHLAVLICLNVAIVGGLALICRTGQLPFGHGAFIGLGAYAAVTATMRGHWPFWLGAAGGALFAALIAAILGWVILRRRSVYFALVTFAFAELVRLVMLGWPSLTGGANGIAGIPSATLFGFAFDTKLRFYGLALVTAATVIAFLYAFFRTPTGHAVDAVAENPALAEASGLSVHRIQLMAFAIGSGIAGLGGALLAHYVGFVSPESFNTGLSVTMITMLVIGGRKSVWGPVIGALILTPLPELFRGAVETQQIFYGAVLILILRFLSGGLASLSMRMSGYRASH